MRLCTRCTPTPETWSEQTAPPGRCGECGRPFDVYGTPIEDEGVTCPVHDPILASCPHADADPDEVPVPAVSWLPDTGGGRARTGAG